MSNSLPINSIDIIDDEPTRNTSITLESIIFLHEKYNY